MKPAITKRQPEKIQFARTLRENQTTMEKFLWQKLRAKRFHGLKFRRQVPFGPYIADFYCAEKRLIIELDGDSHYEKGGQEYDAIRDAYLENNTYTVLRITNSFLRDWLTESLENIGRAAGIGYEE